MNFKHLGVMLDCSRNAVMNVTSVKKYIDILERLGYNTLMLYTEDTYEVDNQPYFGYLRGRYTQKEMQEIDAYAVAHNVELIPCIQTLAHLNAAVRWKTYKAFTDVNDILLCEDERTYQLIEDMFTTLEKCFTSRIVNIGMDEAHMVGLGKYLEKHGFQNRFEILLRHLKKVCEIATAHGFKPVMWSDMFFRLANGGVYTCGNTFDKSVTSLVPQEVSLVYWDYYSKDKARYDSMIQAHRQFDNEIWFAGGLWTWTGFTPKNAFTQRTVDAVIPSLLENGIDNAIFTLWGDDGGECSLFSVLPSLYYTAQMAKGISNMEQIKAGFQAEFGIAFDDFMLLDLPGATDDDPETVANPEKYMFYNDPFSGIFDCVLQDGYEPRYTQCAEKLAELADNKEYGLLFAAAEKISRFLQLKTTIGKRTRAAYQAKDRAALEDLVCDYEKLLALLEDFYQAHRKLWYWEKKASGFDVQDIRIGGLKQRLINCRECLQAYLDGELAIIEELEEEILPEFTAKNIRHNNWASQASVNVMTFGLIGR